MSSGGRRFSLRPRRDVQGLAIDLVWRSGVPRALRPGSVRSADGWREVLERLVTRYRDRKLGRYFRADATFAVPEIYEFLEAKGFKFAIQLPRNQVLQANIAHLLSRLGGRPPNYVRCY